MAVDYFLKLDGVDGESMDDKHKNEIEIISYDFGAANTGTMAYGSGGGSGKVNVEDFTFRKRWDKASSKLFELCCSGKHIPKAIFNARKSTGDGGQQDYLTITFEDLVIASYKAEGTGGDDPIPVDNIAFNFSKIKFDYKPQDQKGALGASVLGGWDIKANKRNS